MVGAKPPGISWEVEKGKHFLRLASQKPGQMLMAYREVPIPAPVQGIEVFIRYRTAGVKMGKSPWFDARAIFHFLDSGRRAVQPDPGPIVFATTTAQWTEVSRSYPVPKGAVALQMMPSPCSRRRPEPSIWPKSASLR